MMDLADLSIRKAATQQELLDVQSLHRAIWALEDIDVHPAHMLMGILESNGLVLCAYRNGEPIGFLVAYWGITSERDLYLHCHNLGVLKSFRNKGVGDQLLAATIEYMSRHKARIARATFDPLESVNANLYIAKAGCTCLKYIRSFYGQMSDQFNRGVPSDRLMIEYRLDSESSGREQDESQSAGDRNELDLSGQKVLNKISIDEDGFLTPEGTDFDPICASQHEVERVLIQIPSNYQEIRERNTSLALKWRLALRELLEKCFELEISICGFICLEGRCYYVLDCSDSNAELGLRH